ncbi:MAG: hypothetical protein HY875_02280 [Chloroflexi bacterium]|nr:hypothetical protein [Chloroflexota bacterium]
MADIAAAAEQFAKDLIAQNIGGLMMIFTPNGMGKAMAMQAQRAGTAQAPATGFSVNVIGPDGDDQVVEITMQSPDGDGVMVTRWKDVAGAWKVDDMSLKA